MKETVYENVSVVEFKTSLVVRELEEGLYAFTRKAASKIKSKSGKLPVAKFNPPLLPTNGLLDQENLDLMLDGKKFKTLDLHILLPEIREIFRTHTFMEAWEICEKRKLKFDRPVLPALDAGATLDDLIRINFNSYTMFTRKGEPLPVGVAFDYISARMNNKLYDLNRAAAILLMRNDIRLLAHEGGHRNDTQRKNGKPATTVEEAVFSIPYYNRDHGLDECLYFIWAPSQEEYKTLLAYCGREFENEGASTMELHRGIFELDLLGLRLHGAAKSDSFYGNE